jgi:hypothetical protein
MHPSAWKEYSQKFGFIGFPEYWMHILHRSPRERREGDFRSCASKPRLLDVVLCPEAQESFWFSPAVLAHNTEQ